jgi:superfamily II DNA or RNA helicase
MNKTRVSTHLGYAVLKSSLTAEQIQKIKTELTVAPKQAGRFAKQADSFTIFLESSTRFYLPRVWAAEEFGPAEESILVDGNSIREDLKFVGKPYDYQNAIIDNFIAKGSNGLICVPCGRGKTFMAISVAAKIGRKFMVVVDKEFLLQQWSGELQALMPGIRIGIIQENKKQIGLVETVVKTLTMTELKEKLRGHGLKVGGSKDELIARLKEVEPEQRAEPVEYDCCIAMIQTLVQRDFAETDFRSFGLTIFDECHHLGAAHFSRALLKIQTKFMLGLSATPTRDDGLTRVFEWFIGKPTYWEKVREADPDVIVRKVDFESDDPAYCNEPVDFRGDVILPTLLTQVLACEARNEMIDELMAGLVAEKDRRILVLSDRKTHLERIERGLPKGATVSYYIGGMKEEVRESGAKTAQVLLGTYAMASEAMNIKTLNTMVMASPRKKIEQSTGRILRVQKDARTVQPLIVDIVDSHGVYQGQWKKRNAYYKKCAYKISKGGDVVDPVIEVKDEVQKSGCLILD